MSFFADYSPPPPGDPRVRRKKGGNLPPPGWAGGRVSWNVVLSRGPDHYAAVTEVVAYPAGCELTLVLRNRPKVIESPPEAEPGEVATGWRHIAQTTSTTFDPKPINSEGNPRFGVGFADGRRAIPYDLLPQVQRYILNPGEQPILQRCGFRHIGGNDVYTWWWLDTLPPAGPLTLAFAWQAQGVVEALTVLDGADIVDAARAAEKLWDV